MNSSTPSESGILDNLNTAVLLFDDDFRLCYMNSAAEVLFAVSKRHMMGQNMDRLLRDAKGVQASKLQQAAITAQPFTEREVTLPLPHGGKVTVDCTIVPFLDRDQNQLLLIELQQMDRHRLISQEERLLNQHQVARELIRSLAHEIKNPLGGLRGAAQLLERELPEPELSEYTRIIIEEADRLRTLVDHMLGPNKPPHIGEVNVHKLLDRVSGLILAEYEHSICVVRDFDPSIPDLRVDGERIIQALLNIAKNAARAVQQNAEGVIIFRTRIERQFTIASRRHRLVARVAIEDNGPGIPEEIRERLFYPMVSSSEDGLGLGLSIAQSIINQNGGFVEWSSEPGKTIFSVLLPLEKNDEQ